MQESIQSPFRAMRDRRDAALLAVCFATAHTVADVWASCRTVQLLTRREVSPYINGCHFNGWTWSVARGVYDAYDSHLLEEHLPTLRDMAHDYLEEHGSEVSPAATPGL